MVERVSITPQVMTLRNASGDATFSTDYRYLKYSTPGELSLTQLNKIPVPYKSYVNASYDGGHQTYDPGYLDWTLSTGTNYKELQRIGVAPAKGTFVISPQILWRWGTTSGGTVTRAMCSSLTVPGCDIPNVLSLYPGIVGYIIVNGYYQQRYYPEFDATGYSVLYGWQYDYYFQQQTAINFVQKRFCGRATISSAKSGDYNLDPSTATSLYIPVEAGDVVQMEYAYIYNYTQAGGYGSYLGQGIRFYSPGYYGVPEGYYSPYVPDGTFKPLGGEDNNAYPLYTRFYSDTATLPLGATA